MTPETRAMQAGLDAVKEVMDDVARKRYDAGNEQRLEAETARREQPPTEKTYLGDSVYAHFDGWAITLETNNGYGPNNTIHLEPEVYEALTAFVGRLQQAATAAQSKGTTDEND